MAGINNSLKINMGHEKLKIDLRAVWYISYRRVLEYRINPDQDLRYYKEHKWLWGLIKFRTVHKYDTNWHRLKWFVNSLTSKCHTYDDSFNWSPIWCNKQETLEWYKLQLPTYGDLCKFIQEHNEKNKKVWDINRLIYLKDKKTLY